MSAALKLQQMAPDIYDSTRRPSWILEEMHEAWRYRDLLSQLIARNIKVRYKRSVLGIAWTMLNPLLIMLILTLVFSNLFRVTLEHYSVYILSALILWNFFSQTTTMAMSELVWGGGLLHHIYVPRTIFALSAAGTGVINLLFSLVPLAIILIVTGVPLTPALLFLPIPILLAAIFALGVGLFLSTLAAYFADVVEIYQVVLTAWMYLTPIIYPLDIVPEKYRWFFNLNPMYHLVEIFRAPIYSGVVPGAARLLIAVAIAGTAFLIGWTYFVRKADEFAYRI
jgi:ABC-type polysaccharide/polyol phosphate export permease